MEMDNGENLCVNVCILMTIEGYLKLIKGYR